MKQLAPSILSADFNCLGRQLKQLEELNISHLHIDVMDGMFVPSISFGMPVIASLRKSSKMFFDVHLMVQEPIRYIQQFCDAGADGLTVHAEACEDLKATVEKIREAGAKAAVSICPSTPVAAIRSILPIVDMVLVMCVEPGFGGQKLIPHTLQKVDELAKWRQENGLSYTIEVDGGVNKENVQVIASHAVDIIVAGTAVFSGNIVDNVKDLQERIGMEGENAS